jgi:DivIVA domain-containing protein
MSDSQNGSSPFEQLMQSAADGSAEGTAFTVGFRGYDRHEVDTAIADLTARLQRSGTEVAAVENHRRRWIACRPSSRRRWSGCGRSSRRP